MVAQKFIQEKDQVLKQKHDQLDQMDWEIADSQDNIKREEEKIATLNQNIKSLQDILDHRSELKEKLIDDLDEHLGGLRFFQRNGVQGNYYRCLKNFLMEKDVLNEAICHKLYPFNMDEETSSYQFSLQASPLNVTKERTSSQLTGNQAEITKRRKQIELFQNTIEDRKRRVAALRTEIRGEEGQISTLKSSPTDFICSPSLKKIDLEDDGGPFVNVPRDNQNGVGTCFANTAKNLLVSLSNGKYVASFLELAALSRKSDFSFADTAINGGHACKVLDEVAKSGFCPQSFSPAETGDRSLLTEGLFADEPSIEGQSRILQLLKDFIRGKKAFSDPSDPFRQTLLSHLRPLMQKLVADPHIKFPLPVLRHDIATEWWLKDFFKDKNPKQEPDAFLIEYKKAYQKFYPTYFARVRNGDNADQIFRAYKEQMRPLFSKYALDTDLVWFNLKENFRDRIAEDLRSKNLKTELDSSLKFLAELGGQSPENCLASLGGINEDLYKLTVMSKQLTQSNVSPDALFQGNNVKSDYELIMLAIAPSCLNEKNRVIPEEHYSCKVNSTLISSLSRLKAGEEKNFRFRFEIISSLRKGLAAGNTFDAHINTIVGARFDEKSKKCQLKIRESQTGTSYWTDESDIYEKMEDLTIVEK